MKSLNKVFLLGHIGHKPEALTTRNGQIYTRLSVATRRGRKDEEDQWQEQTDWHSVNVFGPQAKSCIEHIKKGSLVFIEGQLSPFSKENEDGTKEIRLSIQALKVSFLSSRREIGEAAAS